MSNHTFVVILACGAALLALWIIARFTNFGPHSIVGAVVHVLAASVLLSLVLPSALDAVISSGIPAAAWVQLFGLALPVFTYVFLSGGWFTRAAIGQLR